MALTLLGSSTYILPGQTPTLSVYSVSQPAAGAEWTLTVPAGQTWIIQSIHTILATSATGGTRTPSLQIKAFGAVAYVVPALSSIAASMAMELEWAVGAAYGTVGTVQIAPLSPLSLSPATVIQSATDTLQTDDQYQSITILTLVYS